MSSTSITVAMIAGMPYPMTKASCIRVGHLVRNLVREYEDIRVKVFAYRGADEPPEAHPRIDYHLVAGFKPAGPQYYSWSNKIRADAQIIQQLVKQRRSIDVIHCHTIEGLGIALAFKALSLSKAPICMDVHGPVVPELLHYRLIPRWRPVIVAVQALERVMMFFVRHAFVSNDGLRHLLRERMPADRVSVVYDYVDPDVFDTSRIDKERVDTLRSQYKADGRQILAYVGMFKDYQGVDYLIRAFAALAPRYPTLRLMLIGDGPCRTDHERLIKELDLGDRVYMPGLVPHSDVLNWLHMVDIVVSPRIDNEITQAGFVSQMPEYMALGKVIVATGVSGCPHLLRDGAGILVGPNDEQALVRGIEIALTQSKQSADAQVSKARENVAQFTWRQGIGEVYRVYRQLLAT